MTAQLYRVPVRKRSLKLRSTEPVAYDPAKATVYKLNPTADEIVRLADGERNELDIALALAGGDEALAQELLPEFRAFLDRCSLDGLIEWKA
jgi:hypothetical protein